KEIKLSNYYFCNSFILGPSLSLNKKETWEYLLENNKIFPEKFINIIVFSCKRGYNDIFDYLFDIIDFELNYEIQIKLINMAIILGHLEIIKIILRRFPNNDYSKIFNDVILNSNYSNIIEYFININY